MNVEAKVESCELTAGKAGNTDAGLPAIARLASNQPAVFLEKLDWSVGDDLSLLQQIQSDPSCMASPFHETAWLTAWLETLGTDVELRIVTASLGSLPVIAMPLCLESKGPFKRLCYLAQDVSDYNHPVMHHLLEYHASPAFMAALYRKAGELVPEADILNLRKLLQQPARHPGNRFRQSSREEADATHWAQLSPESWEDARGRFFGKSTRRTLARKEKKIAAGRPVDFDLLKTCDERIEAMQLLARWKGLQLTQLGLANPFLNPDFTAFLTETIRTGDPERLRIYRFSAGNEPVALTFMICTGASWFLYQTAYTDGEASRFSPGMILLRETLREAHEAGVDVFDFGLGDEGYKQKYCDHHASLYRHQLPLTALGVLAMLCSDAKFHLRSIFKSQGILRGAALKALRAVSFVRSRLRYGKQVSQNLLGLAVALF